MCARPVGDVAEAFERAQARLREIVGDERASWPATHMSLAGFGTPEHPVDGSLERRIEALVKRCVSRIPPLRLEVAGIDAFAQDRIPIVRINPSVELTSALAMIRLEAITEGLPCHEGIAVRDWVFHLSLVYFEGDRWSDIESQLRRIAMPLAACVVEELELVGFSGGPERLIARIPLVGSPERDENGTATAPSI